jgi:hypothetical protein
MSPTFIPGKTLSERFFFEVVQPLLAHIYPRLEYAAALIDSGSEVLGFDDAVSTDHHWGPRLQLFVALQDEPLANEISLKLAGHLPYEFMGYPTNFSQPNPQDSGVQLLQPLSAGPVNHRVILETIPSFFKTYLGLDPSRPPCPTDWLVVSEQRLRTVSQGPIFFDQVGLGPVCAQYKYYPHDLWLYLMAAVWTRIGEEEHLMGRAGQAGDELGSALIASRLVRDSMRLCFLFEKVYAPYPKWFGTAFKQLPQAAYLQPVLQAVLQAGNWQERQQYLVAVYEYLARQHNSLNLTARLPECTIPFHNRPFQIISEHGFAGALVEQISDPVVKALASRPLIGSLDLFSDNTALLSDSAWIPLLRQLYLGPLI